MSVFSKDGVKSEFMYRRHRDLELKMWSSWRRSSSLVIVSSSAPGTSTVTTGGSPAAERCLAGAWRCAALRKETVRGKGRDAHGVVFQKACSGILYEGGSDCGLILIPTGPRCSL